MFLNLTKRLLLGHFKDSKASEFVNVTFSIAELGYSVRIYEFWSKKLKPI